MARVNLDPIRVQIVAAQIVDNVLVFLFEYGFKKFVYLVQYNFCAFPNN